MEGICATAPALCYQISATTWHTLAAYSVFKCYQLQLHSTGPFRQQILKRHCHCWRRSWHVLVFLRVMVEQLRLPLPLPLPNGLIKGLHMAALHFWGASVARPGFVLCCSIAGSWPMAAHAILPMHCPFCWMLHPNCLCDSVTVCIGSGKMFPLVASRFLPLVNRWLALTVGNLQGNLADS
jgi:hypothetical protein